ncbi:hypothetical protein DYB37_005765 [Aphanomyces astaci]|uniref:Uncharacterized protein n=1 Tax=Aphanomyces astaci TaxID=112090 RepID=A0A3R7BDN5_APHAT|nr:hypothetical protein DYB35_005099 [Aphanomyces astaci]RHZ26350.1 hypothetical protein DYB37_005765 [Aphanomyces astaci]
MSKVRKRDESTSAILRVMGSTELLSLVFGYQGGIFHDMLPIYEHMVPYELKQYTLQYCPDDVENLLTQYPSARLPLLSECMPYMRNVLFLKAAQFGNLALLRTLESLYTLHHTPGHLLDLAAQNGHLGVLTYLHHHAPTVGCTTSAMDNAASNGHLEIVQFLHTNRTEGCTTRALDYAAAGGHLEVVRFLRTHRHEGGEHAVNYAAANGHVDVVMYLSNSTRGLVTIRTWNAWVPTRQ